MRKIGILGGTFDPPHIGHLIIANEVLQRLSLDEIWFLPNRIPPHKLDKSITATSSRVDMINLAIEDNNHFTMNSIELERSGPSFTYDTIVTLKELHPTEDFFFIIGADMVEYLPKWHRIDELMEMVQFVGVKRAGYQLQTLYPVIEVDIPQIDISSTIIRERRRSGLLFQYLVPAKVHRYIEENNLYE
ncbi:nicotinate-nucleotide adenylyltransferase [Bacillus sp. FJAT-45066]|uniref:nicotinate-nucleotide adenylyltransferase n=1 Tax=Bacillus sp. FJAT-45066 TaxID=2011010 RepID=UPI000BB7E584|nr:nicotinate-nucleotide adenylyltransferase [Bacillus sp. FJAT-45066]